MSVRTTLFLSHSSQDDSFVRDIQKTLVDHGHDVWIDSRELRPGDPLWPDIQKAIGEAAAYAVLVSTDSLQSKWVGMELKHALDLRKQREPNARFPIIPLSLDGTKLGVLEVLFGDEPLYIPVSSEAGGVEAAIHAILVALGKRLPSDIPPTPQPKAEPLEELVLELTDLKITTDSENKRRASASSRLVYEPAAAGKEKIRSKDRRRLTAPLGPIEAEELRWYLEKYAVWPSHYFQDRAKRVEDNLVKWGTLLHEAAMPAAHTANVMTEWAKIDKHAGRRFSIHVDPTLEAWATEKETTAAKEASTLLLGLPWELLHDAEKKTFLFQGAKATRVRRRLPSTEGFEVPVVAPPIRVLLITARPEDEACGYIDHRASALPLVEAMETLGGLVEIHVLQPATVPALRAELVRARTARKPYHVVHFDGHGVYDPTIGLGGLCFEHPEDENKLTKRRHLTVHTDELGPLLRDYRIPLVFLEACQTSMSEKASESVASELLKVGVASVVAMSHSVLVETARRFVHSFYHALAEGQRVGDAMLAGQRDLHDNPSRGRVFGVGDFRLRDWFVPVLFQEKEDPQLFRAIPARQTREDTEAALQSRFGALPAEPGTGFIGRSRELLALQRLLRHERYAVLRGQGGEGKTTLAAEFARWMVRSHQIRRAAFVSVEGMEKNIVENVLDQLGRQLLPNKSFSTQADCKGDPARAEQEILRALTEQSTLLVIDNMESILLPPFLADETPDILSEEAAREVADLLQLCARLDGKADTRLIFTSREALPAPFDAAKNRRELHRLDTEDAVKLVERVLNEDGGQDSAAGDAAREEIEALVTAVHGHARTLALLAPAIRARGVEKTHASLVELMAEMEKQFPGSREQSVFASVELSLRRMSPENRDRVLVLGVFHGGVNLAVLNLIMQWDLPDVVPLAKELIGTGLATGERFGHLTLNPALCPYLRGRLDAAERDALTARWVAAMRAYTGFLVQQRSQSIEVAATLTVLELPNLFALLELVQRAGDPEATIALATSLYSLLQNAGKPRLLERVGQVRDAAAADLEKQSDGWNHARFEAARTRIEQQLDGGQLPEAFDGAQQLLQCARSAGGQAYPGADYDLAGGCWLLARVLQTAGGSEQALPLLDEARQRFEAFAKVRPSAGAEAMASCCFAEQGNCLLDLGRLDEAAAAYEESIRRGEQFGDDRGVAVGKGQLGTVRKDQRRYPEALAAYAEARERFTQLDEPGTVAVVWHQTGIVYQEADQPEAAEDAYRKSLAIAVRLEDVAGQASTLAQLGNMYQTIVDRPEEGAAFYRQAADKYVEIRDTAKEGFVRSNLAVLLHKLRRLDEARQEIRRAIECKAKFGHASEPWKTWATLADIETDAGNPAKAAEAKDKAIASYLAYRHDGGENHDGPGRIALAVTQSLLAGKAPEAAALLQQLTDEPDCPAWLHPFLRALQAIVAGSRDRRLAEAPDLDHTMAAEIVILIETLEQAASAPA